MNGIDRAPAFTYLPYSLPIDLSDDGKRVIGLFGPFESPYWTWSRQRGMENIDGVGFMGAMSGDGRVVGGTLTKRGRNRIRPGRPGTCGDLDAIETAGKSLRTRASRAATSSRPASST